MLLCLPLAIIYALEFALPWDTFTFRTWEAIQVSDRFCDLFGSGVRRIMAWTTLPGPFAPSITFHKVETGDLGHHTAFAIPRDVVWQTDNDGFRKTPRDAARPRVVIVGDSETVGTGLTQEDTLAEVLQREYDLSAYPFAPYDLQDYLRYPRWKEQPPEFVVYESIERYSLDPIPVPRMDGPPAYRPIESPPLQQLEIVWNRIQRLMSIEYLHAQVNGRKQPIERQGVLFLQGENVGHLQKPQQIESVVKSLEAYAAILQKRGSRLAVLIVPDKENTYAGLFPGGPPRRLISRLRTELRHTNVGWVELETDFVLSRQAGQAPHQRDDTHWSAHGVRLAARNLAEWTRGDGRRLPTVGRDRDEDPRRRSSIGTDATIKSPQD